MQQFFILLVGLFYVIAPASTAVLTPSDVGCGSSAEIGDIDLTKPDQRQTKTPIEAVPTEGVDEAIMAFVPIETPLTGSINAPTAFHGAAALKMPRQGPADYRADCITDVIKPAP